MLREKGRIIDVRSNSEGKMAVVECISKSACQSCNNNNSCGVGVVAKGRIEKLHSIFVPYTEGMKINDSVELLIESRDIIKGAVIVYIMPLLVFIIGTALGHLLMKDEPVVIGISLLSLLIGLLLAKLICKVAYPQQGPSLVTSTK